MHLRINSVLGLMKHILYIYIYMYNVRIVKEGAHLVEPFSILSRRKPRLPPRLKDSLWHSQGS